MTDKEKIIMVEKMAADRWMLIWQKHFDKEDRLYMESLMAYKPKASSYHVELGKKSTWPSYWGFKVKK